MKILLLLFLLEFSLTARLRAGYLSVASAPAGAPVSSARFSVQLRSGDGPWRSAPVYSFFQQHDYNWALTTESAFVTFESTGKIEVEVTVTGEAKLPILRPSNRKIAVKNEGASLRFTMDDSSRQLALEVNGDPRHPLVLFSNPPEADTPKPDDPRVTYFGPGYHQAGHLQIVGGAARGSTIYLAPGAVVEGSLAISDGEGTTVRGRGILFCPHPKRGEGGHSPLNIDASRNVRVEGIVLVNRADAWTFRPVASRGITIENFHLFSEIRDGLDIINSQDVKVRDSFFMTHDDAICLKGLAGEGKNQPVEDVRVERCILANMGGGNGIEIGYESVTPVYQRLLFQNIDIIHCLPNGTEPDPYWPEAAISIHPTQMREYGNPEYMGTMPPVRDVTYRDIRIEDCRDDFYFDLRPNRNSPGKGIENILIENVSVVDSPPRPSRVVGLTNHPIRNVTFRNMTVLGQTITKAAPGKWLVENAMGVVFEPATPRPDPGRDGRVTVNPKPTDAPLVNPYSGWGIWAGPRFFDGREFSVDYNTTGFGDDAPLFSWVLLDWMWSDLEPREGEFHWDDLDRVVKYWSDRGKQLRVRLWVTSDPGWAGAPGNKACPDWLWETGVAFQEYRGEGKALKRQPDYAAPSYEAVYLPRLRRFLTAYRDRYVRPGGPVFINDVMGFGDWGEWHVMWSHYKFPNREKKREILGRIIRTYLDVFAGAESGERPHPELSIAHVYDDDVGGDTPLPEAMKRQSLDLAQSLGFTFSRNGFIDGMNGWPNTLIDTYWKSNPMIAESNWSYDQVKDDKKHGTMAEHVDSYIRFHSTYAHMYLRAASYRRAMAEDRLEIERGLRPGGIGYRYVPTVASWNSSLAAGAPLTIQTSWTNQNAAACPVPLALKISLTTATGEEVFANVDRAFDYRTLVPGESRNHETRLALPSNFPPGNYDLRIAVLDEARALNIKLGIAGGDSLGRYRLGAARITK